ncbi:hypothetical protein PEDI_22690 [Persicobacter diffluens]|uniref:Uncharacterized protein n=1 Tax=Persicobacter diffluens TaxID=981 RepID=A0AAN4VYA6_9BACT|nr:hypothetical protein PEDI_22690 [Persicobacter diffluens]
MRSHDYITYDCFEASPFGGAFFVNIKKEPKLLLIYDW